MGLHFAAKRVAFCGKMQPNLPQIALYFAAKYSLFCRKIPLRFAAKQRGNLRQNSRVGTTFRSDCLEI